MDEVNLHLVLLGVWCPTRFNKTSATKVSLEARAPTAATNLSILNSPICTSTVNGLVVLHHASLAPKLAHAQWPFPRTSMMILTVRAPVLKSATTPSFLISGQPCQDRALQNLLPATSHLLRYLEVALDARLSSSDRNTSQGKKSRNNRSPMFLVMKNSGT